MAEAPPLVAPAIAESAAEQRIARNRFDVPALVARADHRFLAGDHRAAAAFYAFALKCPGAASADAAHAERMKRWLAERFREHLMAGIEAAGLPMAEWPPRFRKALEILLGERTRDPASEQFPQLPNYFFYPDLPYVDFVDPAGFTWRTDLERRFDELRDEAAMLLADTADFSPYVSRKTDRPQGDVHGMLENSDWSSLYLWRDGAPVDEHVERCPKTFEALVEHVPLCRIGRMAPAVLFSLLKPGAHIPPHTGMVNIRYICHLPLIVPEGCSLRVGGRVAGWQEGKMLVFDDTVEHEARNASSENRLVLIFDVWNPDLSEAEKLAVRAMLEIVADYR